MQQIDPTVIAALEKIRDWAQDMMVEERQHAAPEGQPQAPPAEEEPPQESELADMELDSVPEEQLEEEEPLATYSFHGKGHGLPPPKEDFPPKGKQPVRRR